MGRWVLGCLGSSEGPSGCGAGTDSVDTDKEERAPQSHSWALFTSTVLSWPLCTGGPLVGSSPGAVSSP